MTDVAPVWGRGLKSLSPHPAASRASRPRMGAWIEIQLDNHLIRSQSSPPYGGVD